MGISIRLNLVSCLCSASLQLSSKAGGSGQGHGSQKQNTTTMQNTDGSDSLAGVWGRQRQGGRWWALWPSSVVEARRLEQRSIGSDDNKTTA